MAQPHQPSVNIDVLSSLIEQIYPPLDQYAQLDSILEYREKYHVGHDRFTRTISLKHLDGGQGIVPWERCRDFLTSLDCIVSTFPKPCTIFAGIERLQPTLQRMILVEPLKLSPLGLLLYCVLHRLTHIAKSTINCSIPQKDTDELHAANNVCKWAFRLLCDLHYGDDTSLQCLVTTKQLPDFLLSSNSIVTAHEHRVKLIKLFVDNMVEKTLWRHKSSSLELFTFFQKALIEVESPFCHPVIPAVGAYNARRRRYSCRKYLTLCALAQDPASLKDDTLIGVWNSGLVSAIRDVELGFPASDALQAWLTAARDSAELRSLFSPHVLARFYAAFPDILEDRLMQVIQFSSFFSVPSETHLHEILDIFAKKNGFGVAYRSGPFTAFLLDVCERSLRELLCLTYTRTVLYAYGWCIMQQQICGAKPDDCYPESAVSELPLELRSNADATAILTSKWLKMITHSEMSTIDAWYAIASTTSDVWSDASLECVSFSLHPIIILNAPDQTASKSAEDSELLRFDNIAAVSQWLRWLAESVAKLDSERKVAELFESEIDRLSAYGKHIAVSALCWMVSRLLPIKTLIMAYVASMCKLIEETPKNKPNTFLSFLPHNLRPILVIGFAMIDVTEQYCKRALRAGAVHFRDTAESSPYKSYGHALQWLYHSIQHIGQTVLVNDGADRNDCTLQIVREIIDRIKPCMGVLQTLCPPRATNLKVPS